MKKRWILLILPLMMALMMNAASANQWGLRGQALNIVEHTHDYDEYSCVADDYKSQTNATRVILGSRYHNQLVAVDEVKDGWKDAIFSTTAVYQPSELEETGYPKITRTKNGFELAYPDIDERYYFELSHNNEGRTFYTLMEAQMGDVKVERIASYGYRVTLGEDSAGRLQHPQHAETRAGRRAPNQRSERRTAILRLFVSGGGFGAEERQEVLCRVFRAGHVLLPRGEGESIRQHGRRL